jgi:hypothetical protein
MTAMAGNTSVTRLRNKLQRQPMHLRLTAGDLFVPHFVAETGHCRVVAEGA